LKRQRVQLLDALFDSCLCFNKGNDCVFSRRTIILNKLSAFSLVFGNFDGYVCRSPILLNLIQFRLCRI
jgi:hypothetical protein